MAGPKLNRMSYIGFWHSVTSIIIIIVVIITIIIIISLSVHSWFDDLVFRASSLDFKFLSNFFEALLIMKRLLGKWRGYSRCLANDYWKNGAGPAVFEMPAGGRAGLRVVAHVSQSLNLRVFFLHPPFFPNTRRQHCPSGVPQPGESRSPPGLACQGLPHSAWSCPGVREPRESRGRVNR